MNDWKVLNPVLRDGYRHNWEDERPALGCIARVINRKTGRVARTEYRVINILVHRGSYDSYVLQNVKTGKISSATLIYAYAPNLH